MEIGSRAARFMDVIAHEKAQHEVERRTCVDCETTYDSRKRYTAHRKSVRFFI